MKVSEHFTLKELVYSPTAIRNGISEQTEPPQQVIDNIVILAENVLEPIRKKFGVTIVSSAYRCPRLNSLVGGSKSSHHKVGMAVDINFGEDNHKLYKFVKDNLKFTQLIWEYGTSKNPDWVHIAFDKDNLSMVETVIK